MGKDNQCEDSTGMIVRDNVWAGGGGIIVTDGNNCSPGPSGVYTASHNLNCRCSGSNNITGAPAFVGGSKPTTYAGYRLAERSAGKGAASDGTDIGIR
jgi:hypothetical protein